MRNVVNFGNAHIPVSECKGLTCITGWNRDSLIAEDQNNAAGKSVLFGSMGTALYDAAPLSRSKSARKEMVGSKDSAIEMLFVDNDGQQVNLTQTPSKYIIEHIDDKGNAVDQRVRGKPAQMEMLREHWPISQSEFYSYIYLQGQKELEFQRGTPVQRQTFLTEVFRLDHYDKLRRHFAKKLDKLKIVSGQHANMSNKLLTIDSRLGEIAYSDKDDERIIETKAELERNIADLEKFGAKSREAKQALSAMSEFSALRDLVASSPKVPVSFADQSEMPWLDTDFLKKEEKALKQWSKFKDAVSTYNENVCGMKKKLETLTTVLPEKKLMKAADKCRTSLDKLEAKCEKQENINREVKNAKKEMSNLLDKISGYGFADIDAIDAYIDIEQEMAMAKATLHLRDLLNSANDAKCPTCTQTVDLKAVKKTVKRAEKQIATLKVLAKARECAYAYNQLSAAIDGKTVDKDKVAKLKLETAAARSNMETYTEELEKVEQAAAIRSAAENLVKPTEPKLDKPRLTEKEIKRTRKYLQTQKETKRSLKALFKAYPALEDTEDPSKLIKKLDKKVKVSKKAYKSASKGVASDQKRLSKLEARRSEHKLLTKQRKEYREEVEGMAALIKDKDLLTDLVALYGKKGMKLDAMANVMSQLEQNLNRYAPRIFFEPIRFSITVADNGGIHVTAHSDTRKDHDVRLLSGSETNCFRLLFMLSMLIMAPARLRTDFIVLDEPDANMDLASQDRFIHEFLPELGKLVPRIFLVTPKPASLYPMAEHWTVIKENGISELHRATDE